MIAYVLCAIAGDQFMRQETTPDEVALIVAEDNQQARRDIKAAREWLKSPELIAQFPLPFGEDMLPVERIVDTVHFAEKKQSPLLQIADACAFVLRRYLERAAHSERFINSLLGGAQIPDELVGLLSQDGGHQYFYWGCPDPSQNFPVA